MSQNVNIRRFGPIIFDYAPGEFFCWHFYAWRSGRILIMLGATSTGTASTDSTSTCAAITNTLGTRNNFLVLLSHCIAFSTSAGSNGAISTGASILIADRYVKFDIIDGRKRILFKCSWSFVNEELYNS